MSELRLWQVEVATDRVGRSPARRAQVSKRHLVNVAARDITAAIGGALAELRERYGDDWDEDAAWVISANHRGAVNRIVE